MRLPVSAINAYIILSIGVVGVMVYDEAQRHKQLFPTAVALTNNNFFHVAASNGVAAVLCLTWILTTRFFFGKVQQAERIRVTEKFFYMTLETCIGLTYFRSALNTTNTLLVVLTQVLKLLHHLGAVRQEGIEQALPQTKVALLKFVSLMLVLFNIDLLCVVYFADATMRDGFGISVLLTLDYALMLILTASTSAKLLLHQYEAFRGGIWDAKGTIRFYCEIIAEALSCVLYIGFFAAMCRYTFVPFHLIREVIVNVRNVLKTVNDFLTYRVLVDKLDRLADPSDAQLEDDPKCSICYDDIAARNSAKRLPCGHIFHKLCLCRWLERNNNCPYCLQAIEVMMRNVPDAAPAPPAPQANAGGDAEGAPGDDDAREELIRRMYREYVEAARREQQPAGAAVQPAPVAMPDAAAAPRAAGTAGARNVPPTSEAEASASSSPRTPIAAKSRLLLRPAATTDAAPGAAPPTTEAEAHQRYVEAVDAARAQLDADLARVRAAP